MNIIVSTILGRRSSCKNTETGLGQCGLATPWRSISLTKNSPCKKPMQSCTAQALFYRLPLWKSTNKSQSLIPGSKRRTMARQLDDDERSKQTIYGERIDRDHGASPWRLAPPCRTATRPSRRRPSAAAGRPPWAQAGTGQPGRTSRDGRRPRP